MLKREAPLLGYCRGGSGQAQTARPPPAAAQQPIASIAAAYPAYNIYPKLRVGGSHVKRSSADLYILDNDFIGIASRSTGIMVASISRPVHGDQSFDPAVPIDKGIRREDPSTRLARHAYNRY